MWIRDCITSSFYLNFRLYQIRCSLRASSRLPIQVETCIPEASSNAFPSACIVGGTGHGGTHVFQILYRNEEVSLKESIIFRAHLLGDFYCTVNDLTIN